MTLTPLQCIDMLPAVKKESEDVDPYAGMFYLIFRRIVEKAIRMRFLTIGTLVALLVVAFIGFGKLDQMFFPDSSMSKFMVDYWAPEGTRIQTVAADL